MLGNRLALSATRRAYSRRGFVSIKHNDPPCLLLVRTALFSTRMEDEGEKDRGRASLQANKYQ
jgi:hypothetical protein